jgi:hypothetical protein
MKQGIVLILAVGVASGFFGCKPADAPVASTQTGNAPPIIRVHSFAFNEVRLAATLNGSTSLYVGVGNSSEHIPLEFSGHQEIQLLFKKSPNGFVVENPNGLFRKEFSGLPETEFLTPPVPMNGDLLLGFCRGAKVIVRLDKSGSQQETIYRLPDIPAESGGLCEYRLRFLPAVQDMAEEIDRLRERTGKRYYFCIEGGGRMARSVVGWGTYMWPENSSDFVFYHAEIIRQGLSFFFWQAFYVDPKTGEVFLVRDRRTGELIKLRDWLDLEEKTCLYTLEEIMAGADESFEKEMVERDARAGESP